LEGRINKIHKGNQFRALEEDEVNFLDSMVTRLREEERKRKAEEGENLDLFRRYNLLQF
jgi:hypothetical protein